MKAIAIDKSEPGNAAPRFITLDLPTPVPGPRDLLVRVKAVSVNPVDFKMRRAWAADATTSHVLGWDAAGVVEDVGEAVTLFQPGDEVYYAGDLMRPGANSELHLVDERIVGRKPRTLSFEEAAALPLTSLTVWEALFERMPVARDGSAQGKRLLIVGGAGGVGSIGIQLAKQVAGLRVVATASREASKAWCLSLGADLVVDHSQDLRAQYAALGEPAPDFVLLASDFDPYFEAVAELVAPQGYICGLVASEQPVNLALLYMKSASVVWELMFSRSMFQTSDMIAQHRALNEVAALVDAGRLQSTLTQIVGPIDAVSLATAHATLEGGRVIGKLVLGERHTNTVAAPNAAVAFPAP